MDYVFLGIIAIMIALIVFGFIRKLKGILISLLLFVLIFGGGLLLSSPDEDNPLHKLSNTFDFDISKTVDTVESIRDWGANIFNFAKDKVPERPTISSTDRVTFNASDYYIEPLTPDTPSSISEGAVKYGAIIVLGELDELSRSTFGHIRLKEEHEPGYIIPGTNAPREKRNDKINVDPVGWKNFKIGGKWANNRCHLIGYQFSALNDELRNLATGTSYLNKGNEGAGMDEGNPDGMLFYEQALDRWLSLNPTAYLDLYTRPIYQGSNLTPTAYYMQWVGYDEYGSEMSISIGGHSEQVAGNVNGVVLMNASPSYNIDYVSGIVTAK